MKSPLTHFVIMLGAAVLALGGYVVWYTTLSKKSADAVALQEQIAATAASISRMSSARVALAEVAGDEATIESYFVAESDVVSFINELEAAAGGSGAKTNVLSVSASGTAAEPMLVLAVSIEGSFDEVMRAVGTIEYFPYAITISSLSVQKVEDAGWHVTASLTVASVPAIAALSESTI